MSSNTSVPSGPSVPLDPFHTHELIQNTFDDLPHFSFQGNTLIAKVTEVYDGDTATIVFYHLGQPVKHKLRLFGYDAPELKPLKSIPCRELHIQAAQAARDHLKSQILGKLVWVKFCKEEKYGRLMGTIYLVKEDKIDCMCGQEIDMNQQMVGNGYGKAYGGGQKEQFCEEELNKIIGGKI